jgi:hypothetical protein
MKRNEDGTYHFKFNGKIYRLEFDGDSPRVTLNGEKQMAKRILREYILQNNVPIELFYFSKEGIQKEKTTNQLGKSFKENLGHKKLNGPQNKDARRTKVSQKVEASNNKLHAKLKSDYNRRKRAGLNDFETEQDFFNWYFEQEKKCTYCKISEEEVRFIVINGILQSKRFPENGLLKQGKARGYYLEVDRKNPKNGYSSDNCVLACYFCNNDKSDVFDYDSYQQFFQKRKEYLQELIKNFPHKGKI